MVISFQFMLLCDNKTRPLYSHIQNNNTHYVLFYKEEKDFRLENQPNRYFSFAHTTPEKSALMAATTCSWRAGRNRTGIYRPAFFLQTKKLRFDQTAVLLSISLPFDTNYAWLVVYIIICSMAEEMWKVQTLNITTQYVKVIDN